jgi:Uma2 family endonuclease
MSTAMENLRPPHRINVDEFFRMVDSGVLGEDVRVELIDGEIIDMEPIGIDHGWVVDELTAMFHSSLGDRGAVRTQGALRVDDWNFFLPDVTVLTGPRGRYRHRHPTVDDILVVIEVADSSLRKDMNIKRPIYLRHSAAEIWIIDVQKMMLHVQRASDASPAPQTVTLTSSASVSLHALPGVVMDLSPLAPR